MFKGKLVVLSLIAAALLSWQVMPASVEIANSGIVDPCSSYASESQGDGCWLICPIGDGEVLNNLSPKPGDATITVTVRDATGAPIPGIPAADFWLIGCNDNLALQVGGGSINATAATDVNGQTTIVGTLIAGGCDPQVSVVVQGAVLLDPSDWSTPLCLDIYAKSPDGNGDGQVQNIDFTQFGNAYGPLGGVYDICMDFDCSGAVQNIDFTQYGNHNQHGVPAP